MDFIIPAGFDAMEEKGKMEAITELVSGVAAEGFLDPENIEIVAKAIFDREQMGSTGIINGVGVPHVRHLCIERQICLVGRSNKGVEFQALDGNPVFIFFLLLGPKAQSAEHLERLAAISLLIRDGAIIRALREAADVEAMKTVLKAV